jgi:uncharacterized membrane protein
MDLKQKPAGHDGIDYFQGGPWEIGAALSGGWDLFKDNVGLLLGTMGVNFAVNMVFSFLNQGVTLVMQNPDLEVVGIILSLLLTFVSFIVQSLLTLGILKVYLGVVRGQNPSLGEMFNVGHLVVPTIVASMGVALAVFTGTMFLIVPGIILGLGLMFTQLVIADQEVSGLSGAIDAMKESWRLTEGEKGNLFLWGLVGMCVMIGALCTCVGIFVAGPVLGLGTAMIYDNLVQRKRLA